MRWSRSFTINISSLSLVFHSWFIFSCLSLCPELHISLLFHIQKTPGRDEIKGEREVNEGQDIRKQEPRDKDDEWDEGVKTSTRSICPMHRLFSYLHFHHISIVGNLISCVSMLVSPLPVLSFPLAWRSRRPLNRKPKKTTGTSQHWK